VSALELSEISLLNLFAVTLFELMVVNNWYVIMVSTVINICWIQFTPSSAAVCYCYATIVCMWEAILSLLCHQNVAAGFTTLYVVALMRFVV